MNRTLFHTAGPQKAKLRGPVDACILWVASSRRRLHNSGPSTTLHCDTNLLRPNGKYLKLECGPMSNAMVALPNTGGALCLTPQSLADARY